MLTPLTKYRLTFRCFSDPESWVHGLLTDHGMYGDPPVLLDWSYDQCGGESINPSRVDADTFQADVWILDRQDGPEILGGQLTPFLREWPGMEKVEVLAQTNVDVPSDYVEGDFLREVFA